MTAKRSLFSLCLAAALLALASARAAEPITIGFSMELTGPFAVVGKTGLLAFKIWEEEVNAKGGLLGRPVKLVYYDDQSNPATGAGDLHEADRCRQSRSLGVELRHQSRGAGDAGRDLAQQAVLRDVRARRQRQVPLSEILLDAAVRARSRSRPLRKAFSTWRRRRTRSRKRSRSSPPTPNFSTRRRRARASTPRQKGSTSSTTAPIRRPRSISRRSSAR